MEQNKAIANLESDLLGVELLKISEFSTIRKQPAAMIWTIEKQILPTLSLHIEEEASYHEYSTGIYSMLTRRRILIIIASRQSTIDDRGRGLISFHAK